MDHQQLKWFLSAVASVSQHDSLDVAIKGILKIHLHVYQFKMIQQETWNNSACIFLPANAGHNLTSYGG